MSWLLSHNVTDRNEILYSLCMTRDKQDVSGMTQYSNPRTKFCLRQIGYQNGVSVFISAFTGFATVSPVIFPSGCTNIGVDTHPLVEQWPELPPEEPPPLTPTPHPSPGPNKAATNYHAVTQAKQWIYIKMKIDTFIDR